MSTLSNKIDFAVIVCVKNANPNGDPLNGNRPRVNYEGFGELSDVCIKRKIRNRLMETGHSIFVQSDDNRVDDYRSLRSRAEGVLKNVNLKDDKKYREAACKQWIDVRAFGQVFAYKGAGDDAGVFDRYSRPCFYSSGIFGGSGSRSCHKHTDYQKRQR